MAERTRISIGGLERTLRQAREQLPFAMALTLTALAKDGQAEVERLMPTIFDRPTPFTQRAVGIVPASKALPIARVLLKPTQATYLLRQVRGGLRQAARGEVIAPPVQIRTNAYGNIGRGRLASERQRSDTFVASAHDPATAHLPPGLYRRARRRARGSSGAASDLTLLVAFHPRAAYQARFHFALIVERAVGRMVRQRAREAVVRALTTARR